MSLLNVGARALLANQMALQTAGHNVANVNTPGYSRQNVVLQTTPGQYTGGGYIGQGVDVQTVVRNYSALLTSQSTAAGSVSASDSLRADRLAQLQEIFSGGPDGLGAAISDMMNALSSVVNAPTDLTARTVALTRMDEMASRMRSSGERLDGLEYTVREQLKGSVDAINSLASSIANINDQIARARGNGQTPNDLLDQRDQLIRDLNRHVQTTQVEADDGSLGLFVAGSQPLVLGNTATRVSVDDAAAFPGSRQIKLFFERPGSPPMELDENVLGGGEVSGLLRFHNSDLAEGRNLIGRMALAIGMNMNAQHRMGLTLDGQPGRDLFAVPTSMPAYTSGSGIGSVGYSDATQFAASDYEIRFTASPAGVVVRLSDNSTTPFTDLANLASQEIDGLRFNLTAAGASGERMLFKPFASAAANIEALVYSPRELAAANPVQAAMGAANAGSVQLERLRATPDGFAAPGVPAGVVLTFTAGPPVTYGVTGSTTPPTGTTGLAYTPGAPIVIDGWELTLRGTPKTGDSVTVRSALDPQVAAYAPRDTGNAGSLLALRDVKMFDESTLTDGYASVMAQVGTRTQSAAFAAELSATIASTMERDRTAVSGVNLDEEASRLIQFQQAYQASAKMLQIAQNIFDNLMQSLR